MPYLVEVCPQEVDLALLLEQARPVLLFQLLLVQHKLDLAIRVVLLRLLRVNLSSFTSDQSLVLFFSSLKLDRAISCKMEYGVFVPRQTTPTWSRSRHSSLSSGPMPRRTWA